MIAKVEKRDQFRPSAGKAPERVRMSITNENGWTGASVKFSATTTACAATKTFRRPDPIALRRDCGAAMATAALRHRPAASRTRRQGLLQVLQVRPLHGRSSGIRFRRRAQLLS